MCVAASVTWKVMHVQNLVTRSKCIMHTQVVKFIARALHVMERELAVEESIVWCIHPDTDLLDR